MTPNWTPDEAPVGGDRFRRLCAKVESDPKRRGFSEDERIFCVPEHWLRVLEYIVEEDPRLIVNYDGYYLWQLVACTKDVWRAADQQARGSVSLGGGLTLVRATTYRPLADLIRSGFSGLIFGTYFDDNLLGALKQATAPKRS